MSRAACLAAAALISQGTFAACADQPYADPHGVRIWGNRALLVTHASAAYDARLATKPGVDEAIRFARDERMPLVFLHDGSPHQLDLMDDCAPDYWVYSEGGEIDFDVPSHLYVAGGHLELCLSTTLHEVLMRWARQPRRDLTLTYLMDAIYSNGKSVEERDRFYPAISGFMAVVTYGRPVGERWPKLSLLEAMGVIGRTRDQMEFLERVLPHYTRTMPRGYRVELVLNDMAVKVLQPGDGLFAPTLRFEFVDSAGHLQDLFHAGS